MLIISWAYTKFVNVTDQPCLFCLEKITTIKCTNEQIKSNELLVVTTAHSISLNGNDEQSTPA